jgi:hypothetical protein
VERDGGRVMIADTDDSLASSRCIPICITCSRSLWQRETE